MSLTSRPSQTPARGTATARPSRGGVAPSPRAHTRARADTGDGEHEVIGASLVVRSATLHRTPLPLSPSKLVRDDCTPPVSARTATQRPTPESRRVVARPRRFPATRGGRRAPRAGAWVRDPYARTGCDGPDPAPRFPPARE